MKPDTKEDVGDNQEIQKQKEELKRTKEEMSKWEYGKGIIKDKEGKHDVRS